MNGSVPSIFDKPNADRIDAQAKELLHTFYNGDRLTPFELDTERMYVSEKLDKHQNY